MIKLKEIEAIEAIKSNKPTSGYTILCEALDMAVEALETMQQMKERNITQETILEYAKFEDECVKKGFTFKSLLEAREKQIPKKPSLEGDGYADGHLVYDTWICPCCEKKYEVDYEEYDYCPECGQAIDWSEDDGES